MLDPSRPLESSFVDLGGESQWPGYEAAYDDASSSAILGMSSELMVQPDDPEGPLLDALARLHAEQARAQRLENALDVSRALGGLSHSPKPTKAAVCVQSFLRGHRARGVAAAARARWVNAPASGMLLRPRAAIAAARPAQLHLRVACSGLRRGCPRDRQAARGDRKLTLPPSRAAQPRRRRPHRPSPPRRRPPRGLRRPPPPDVLLRVPLELARRAQCTASDKPIPKAK